MGAKTLDAKRCGEILVWLEGVYARRFPEEVHRGAWTLLHDRPEDVVDAAAIRMVDEGERDPSPAAWLRRVKVIEEERRHEERMRATQQRLSDQLPPPDVGAGREAFAMALADLGKFAPRYPGMGTREILMVRHLIEVDGKTHDEAYAMIFGARKK